MCCRPLRESLLHDFDDPEDEAFVILLIELKT